MNLVVVSNRVARAKANEPMTGGLAAALLPVVELPHSRIKENVAKILKTEGYVTDVAVDPGFLPPLLRALDDPRVAAAGPKIFYFDPPDRLWAAGGRLRIRETVTVELGRGELDGPAWNQPADVTYLTTCCLLVSRQALTRVGLFDSTYFINVDDADWCRRALDAGLALRYVPESRIWHKVAASTAGSYTPTKTFHTGRSNALYVRRHGGLLGLAAFLAANLAALPLAWLRELPRGNAHAVAAKARGVLRGLTDPLPEPPRLELDEPVSSPVEARG